MRAGDRQRRLAPFLPKKGANPLIDVLPSWAGNGPRHDLCQPDEYGGTVAQPRRSYSFRKGQAGVSVLEYTLKSRITSPPDAAVRR
ncbi:hypothetical protein MHEI_41340 [Mycobacterium heidelbergense]|nr:hypothetical protein MHEI_41340 [Mycobacterium heidelbergense]